ncbi:hypothetical protein D3C81_1434560 [compost metagenome]
MSETDLAGLPLQDLLQEIARRCGGTYAAPKRAGGMKHATKEAWARAQAAEVRAKYEQATDPSLRAQLMQDMARYEGMASTYKRKGI